MKYKIGTKIYSFRDNPFCIINGKIIKKSKKKGWYVCEWYDPIIDFTYTEIDFEPMLSRKEAKKSHEIICKLLFNA
jgi:hypothetical protein